MTREGRPTLAKRVEAAAVRDDNLDEPIVAASDDVERCTRCARPIHSESALRAGLGWRCRKAVAA